MTQTANVVLIYEDDLTVAVSLSLFVVLTASALIAFAPSVTTVGGA